MLIIDELSANKIPNGSLLVSKEKSLRPGDRFIRYYMGVTLSIHNEELIHLVSTGIVCETKMYLVCRRTPHCYYIEPA